MGSGLSLGRIFGIRITIQWSLLLIFWLVAFNLAAGLLPIWHPDWSAALQWAVAIIATTLLFASILVHELSHALVGKAVGAPVQSITLFIFGGAASIDKEPSTPRAEFAMAAVGPVVSAALGLIFLVAGGYLAGPGPAEGEDVMDVLRRVGPGATLCLWLGPVNLMLAIFNMVPGFPLDGGRVLRAALWAITGDLIRATRWAARSGQAFAWLLIGSGVAMMYGVWVPLLGTGVIQGLWLIFIGWFLNGAAAASYQQLVVRGMLEGLPVSQLMRRDVRTVEPETTLSRVVSEITDQDAFPVVHHDRLVGLVSLTDIRAVPRAAWPSTLVATVMTPAGAVATATPTEDAFQARRDIGARNVALLPVVEGDHLLGIISRVDILKWLELHSIEARQSS